MPDQVRRSRGGLLGNLKSGESVFDRNRSHLHGTVRDFLAEAFGKTECLGRDFIAEQVDLGRIIGHGGRVKTTDADDIVYARRYGRKGLSRFVLGRSPDPTCYVTIVLKRDGLSEDFLCLTAYVGPKSEPEPWDVHATPASLEFWQNHALIWDGEEIVPNSEGADPDNYFEAHG